jgi:hypothetical protein
MLACKTEKVCHPAADHETLARRARSASVLASTSSESRSKRVSSAHVDGRPAHVESAGLVVDVPAHNSTLQAGAQHGILAGGGSPIRWDGLQEWQAPAKSPRGQSASAPPIRKTQLSVSQASTAEVGKESSKDGDGGSGPKPRLTRSAAAEPSHKEVAKTSQPAGHRASHLPLRMLPQRQGLHNPRSPRAGHMPDNVFNRSQPMREISPMDIDSPQLPPGAPLSGPESALRVSLPSPRARSGAAQPPRFAKGPISPTDRKTRSGECSSKPCKAFTIAGEAWFFVSLDMQKAD